MFTHAAFVVSNATVPGVANTSYSHYKPGHCVFVNNVPAIATSIPKIAFSKEPGLLTYTNQRRKTAPAMYFLNSPTLRIVSGF